MVTSFRSGYGGWSISDFPAHASHNAPVCLGIQY
jgi:hypothetical protein